MLRLAIRFVTAALVVITLSLTTAAGPKQTAASVIAPPQADVDALVTRFVTAADEYHKVFLNLTAVETRLIEIFDQSGGVDKRREIISDLVVYQPPRDPGDPEVLPWQATTEYRDVRSVDGKAITKRSVRALELVTRASQSNTIKKELEAIDRESARYDLNYRLFGSTYQNGLMLRERQKFRIDWAGRDQVNGHDVVVLDYQEIAPNRNNPDKSFYEQYGFSASLVRGRLWIDVKTAQLRREQWEFAGVHPALPQPVTVVRREATYVESRFGVLVPDRVVLEMYAPAKQKKKQPPAFFRGARATCAFKEFRPFEVTTQQTIATPAAPPSK